MASECSPGQEPASSESSTCLLDLNDDALLEIIARLRFIDRARFCGASRRLRLLEAAARAIDDEQFRYDFGVLIISMRETTEKANNVDAGTEWVGELSLSGVGHNMDWHPPLAWNPPAGPNRPTSPYRPHWPSRDASCRKLTTDGDSSMILLARAIKCCTFEEVHITHRNVVDPELLKATLKVLRAIKTNKLELDIGLKHPREVTEYYDGVDPLVSIDSLLWAMDNGALRHLRLFPGRTWATSDQLLALIKKMRENDIPFRFSDIGLETAQKFALQEMGIAPEVLENSPTNLDDIAEIRTTKKGEVVYAGRESHEVFILLLKDRQGFIELYRFTDDGRCFLNYNWDPEEGTIYDESRMADWDMIRVPELD